MKKLFELLVMRPNRAYDNIKNPNVRFLTFFVPLALMIILFPTISLLFGVLNSPLIMLTQLIPMLILLAWRGIYLYVERII
jgi:hypothetical protein